MEKVQVEGHMVVDPATVIVTHLTEIIRRHSWEILTRAEVQSLLDGIAKVYPRIVDELIPTHMTLGGVQRVLQNLLRERVPVNDIVTILETLLDIAPSTKDIDIMTEHVRRGSPGTSRSSSPPPTASSRSSPSIRASRAPSPGPWAASR